MLRPACNFLSLRPHAASMHEGDHFQAIAGEIGRRRRSGKEPRAVLVFFRHVDKLKRFRDSSYFDAFRETSGIAFGLIAVARIDAMRLE
eukprot:51875-Pleurochrysis_carterae.AAC.1